MRSRQSASYNTGAPNAVDPPKADSVSTAVAMLAKNFIRLWYLFESYIKYDTQLMPD